MAQQRAELLSVPVHPQAYGVVWKAVDKKNNNLVALKKIFDAFQNATDAQVRGAAAEGLTALLGNSNLCPTCPAHQRPYKQL